jgi:hypothetical protein
MSPLAGQASEVKHAALALVSDIRSIHVYASDTLRHPGGPDFDITFAIADLEEAIGYLQQWRRVVAQARRDQVVSHLEAAE